MFAEQLAEAGRGVLTAVLEAPACCSTNRLSARGATAPRHAAGPDDPRRGVGRAPGRDAARGLHRRPSTTGTGALVASMQGHTQKLMLVDDETVQKEIFISRLSQGIRRPGRLE